MLLQCRSAPELLRFFAALARLLTANLLFAHAKAAKSHPIHHYLFIAQTNIAGGPLKLTADDVKSSSWPDGNVGLFFFSLLGGGFLVSTKRRMIATSQHPDVSISKTEPPRIDAARGSGGRGKTVHAPAERLSRQGRLFLPPTPARLYKIGSHKVLLLQNNIKPALFSYKTEIDFELQ